ncbi:D-3-phosphoglycerate dehydrogenase [Pilibacter termitis]|uniref:D-3-phosphoglycerate dehydrogenase n=1 Tax=Pilibacter termitis TaxID=263852 RepID=A0A1T4MQ69_9ENTE|nr:phosphoglycerate dehydrogenase [Pilibacter termitis]SJZ68925.1 D-3-phosphoglycerate dehydrogenase [Pilibacter termitis]
MYEVKSYNNIAKVGLEQLDKNLFTVDTGAEASAYLIRSENLHDVELPSHLKAIARAGAGVNNIPVDEASERGIVVFNTPGANANAVKEAVLTGLLVATRGYIPASAWIQTQAGSEVGKTAEKGKKNYAGTEISGKRLGIIGLGAIGVMVANAANSLGMEVVGFDPFVSVDTAWKISRAIKRVNSLEELLAQVDFLTIHVPFTSETKGYISSEQIAQMKDGAVILNFARGELVDNTALLSAIDSGKIAKYVTDFAMEEIMNKEQVIVFPHLGASTEEAEENCAVMAAETLNLYFKTGEIRNSVNFPSISVHQKAPYRLVAFHRNVPNMLGQISTLVAKHDINIAELVNRSKEDYAVTMLDLEEGDRTVVEQIKSELEAIEHIIRVRLIG